MLRYLSRSEVASDRAIQWGVLTNGAVWRLYWQSARSRSEEFLEFDLAELAGVAGVNSDLFAPANTEQVHYLRTFFLLFRREAFLPQLGDAGTGAAFMQSRWTQTACGKARFRRILASVCSMSCFRNSQSRPRI